MTLRLESEERAGFWTARVYDDTAAVKCRLWVMVPAGVDPADAVAGWVLVKKEIAEQ